MDDVVLAMYLNIIKYIDDDRQKDLMEMIGLSEKIEEIIAQIKKDSEKKGERKIIKKLLKTFTEDEVSKILDMEKKQHY